MNQKLKEINNWMSEQKYSDVREKILNDTKLQQDAEICRKWAMAFYHDSTLEFEYATTRAIGILDSIAILLDNDSSETLRLKGAVYKRIWEKTENLDELNKALKSYLESIGEEDDIEKRIEDKGYGVINVLNLYIFKDSISKNKEYEEKIKKLLTQTIDLLKAIENNEYSEIVKQVERKKGEKYKNYWFYTTMAQLYVIKKDYKKVKNYLEKAKNYLKKQKDKIDNEKRQKHIAISEIFKTIKYTNQLHTEDVKEFIKEEFPTYFEEDNIEEEKRIELIEKSIDRGKLGLALSGGGFRASLFHLGVLSRLAEIDMLRNIETISAVSGGSIIAMAYYLKLKNELEKYSYLTHKQYIELVKGLKEDFIEAVQGNIRIKAFCDWGTNWKIIGNDLIDGDYTRTNYLGKLYFDKIYKKYTKTKENDSFFMKNIKIYPKDKSNEFHPYYDNWSRYSKIPNLIINATSFTTGHNWKITASGMGETKSMINGDIDKNRLYEFCDYEEFHKKGEKLSNFKVSDAVASSSAVPGLFEPIVIDTGIKGEKIKLLDGGVYDNQGIQSLVHDNCDVILCSDASGYFEDNLELSSNKNKIFMRMADNLMDINRDFLYKQTQEQLKQGKIKAFEYFHLKKELPVDEVDLKNGKNISAKLSQDTSYEVNMEIQDKLSRLRTDLDSFSDLEAYSLMLCGYNMCKYSEELNKWNDFYNSEENQKFDFIESLKGIMITESKNKTKQDRLKSILDVGKNIPFKLFQLSKVKDIFTIKPFLFLTVVVFLLMLYFCDFSSKNIAFLMAGIGVVYLTNELLIKRLNPRWINLFVNVLFGILFYPFIWFYEKYLNSIYNKKGEI